MYGLALPLLFPIAAFTFLNLLLMERILITYFHSKPPMYDDKLNKQTLNLMAWAPIVLCMFGYWFLGEPQIFDNVAIPQNLTSDVEITGQTAAPTGLPNLPFFVFFIIFTLWLFFNSCCKKLMIKLRLMSPEEDPEVNEGLGTYFQCVPNYMRKSAYAEECYKREKLGLKTMSDANLEKLRTTKGGKKMIEGPSTYNLIMDIRYKEAFCYDAVADRDTPEEEALSDLITQMLYLGYVREGSYDKVFDNMKGMLQAKRQAKKNRSQGRQSMGKGARPMQTVELDP